MSLKDLTKEKHTDAERTEFANLLLSGNITTEQYALYLLQMLEVYSVLEFHCARLNLFEDLAGLPRVLNIYNDLKELGIPTAQLKLLDSSKNYINYLNELAEDEQRNHLLMAHLYVRHMGDLFGGQMIKQKVPGSGSFYEFNNRSDLIAKVRSKLDDNLGDEANVAFDHAINIMKELNEPSLEQAH